MKTNLAKIVALILGVVAAAAAQDACPALGGVKPPVMLTLALYVAFRSPLAPSLAAALALGLFSDALAGLDAFHATVFFPLAASLLHAFAHFRPDVPGHAVGLAAVPMAAVLGELVLSAFGLVRATANDGVVRLVIALGLALFAGPALFLVLTVLERLLGIDTLKPPVREGAA